MSTPIYFDGVEYPNLEAMSAAVRAAYDAQAEEDEGEDKEEGQDDETDDAEADANQASAVQPPAWAGASASATVLVPHEFEPVTGLGPAIKVTPHKGIRLLPSFGPPHITQLVRYRDGLAFHAGGKETLTLTWEDVATITSNLVFHPEQHNSWTDHEYTLTKSNGEKLVLDDGLKDVAGEMLAIKQAVYALLRPPALRQYKDNQPLTFGPVSVHKPAGLQLDGKPYAWSAVKDVQVTKGQLQATLTNGQKHAVRLSSIPNFELLCQIIGVQYATVDLAYWAFL